MGRGIARPARAPPAPHSASASAAERSNGEKSGGGIVAPANGHRSGREHLKAVRVGLQHGAVVGGEAGVPVVVVEVSAAGTGARSVAAAPPIRLPQPVATAATSATVASTGKRERRTECRVGSEEFFQVGRGAGPRHRREKPIVGRNACDTGVLVNTM